MTGRNAYPTSLPRNPRRPVRVADQLFSTKCDRRDSSRSDRLADRLALFRSDGKFCGGQPLTGGELAGAGQWARSTSGVRLVAILLGQVADQVVEARTFRLGNLVLQTAKA